MISILGENMNEFRPSRFNKPKVYRNEKPRIKYDETPKNIEENSRRVIAVCIKVKDRIYSLTKGLHINVCVAFGIKPKDVEKAGWELDNGNFVWR